MTTKRTITSPQLHIVQETLKNTGKFKGKDWLHHFSLLSWFYQIYLLRLSFAFREFNIRLRRDTELFTHDFVAENGEFDPGKVVTGDVKGILL